MGTQISIVNSGFDETGDHVYKEEIFAYVMEGPLFVLEMAIHTWPIFRYNNVSLGLTKLPGIIIRDSDRDQLKWGLEIKGEFRHLRMEHLLLNHPSWGKNEFFSPRRSKEDLYKALRDIMAIELRDLRTMPNNYLDIRDKGKIGDLEEKTLDYLVILDVITGKRNRATIDELKEVLAGKYPKGDDPHKRRVELTFTDRDLRDLDSLKSTR